MGGNIKWHTALLTELKIAGSLAFLNKEKKLCANSVMQVDDSAFVKPGNRVFIDFEISGQGVH